MKLGKRPLMYLLVCGIFLVMVFIKIQVIINKQQTQVVSQITEWKVHGKPVVVDQMLQNDFEQYLKVSARSVGSKMLESYVSNNMWSDVRAGQPFYILLNEKKFTGTVHAVGQSLDLSTGLYPISLKLDIENKNLSDLIIPVYIRVKFLEKSLSLNNDALFEKDQKQYVWISKDQKAILKQVKTTIDNGERSLVASGLDVGDLVVTSGKNIIQENDLLKIVLCTGCK